MCDESLPSCSSFTSLVKAKLISSLAATWLQEHENRIDRLIWVLATSTSIIILAFLCRLNICFGNTCHLDWVSSVTAEIIYCFGLTLNKLKRIWGNQQANQWQWRASHYCDICAERTMSGLNSGDAFTWWNSLLLLCSAADICWNV